MMPMIAAAGSSGRASYSTPKAAKPATAAKAKRQKGGSDHALKAAAAVYDATVAADVALDARMRTAGRAEMERLEQEGSRIIQRRGGAVLKAIRLEAATPTGVSAKAAMLEAEIIASKPFALTTDSPVLKLAASLSADVRRIAAATSLAAVLKNEDAGPDAELIEACAAWPAVTAAYLAEQEDGGPANRAMDALASRVSAMKPRTVAGMLAKARVAKAEAVDLHGRESPSHTYAETVAWDLLNDLLRLTGEGA